MKIIKDSYGNAIYDKNNTIFLALAEGSRLLRIAKINKAKNALEMFRDYEQHLFKKANSYGFNYELLVATKLKYVLLKTTICLPNKHIKKEEFLIPIDVLIEKGEFLFFKQQGFEIQIFLSLEKLEKYRLKE